MLKKLLFILTLFVSTVSYAQSVSENDVKAAFIFHFISFTQWNDNQSQYYVCIPEDTTLRNAASELFKDKSLNNRKIFVVDRYEGCHVLVSDHLPYTQSTLTIGNIDKGALIEFRMAKNKLKFAVNVDEIKKSKLKISSQLLKLGISE